MDIKIDAKIGAETRWDMKFEKVWRFVKKYPVFMSFWLLFSAIDYLRSLWKRNSTTDLD
jgi:hypothetical protein